MAQPPTHSSPLGAMVAPLSAPLTGATSYSTTNMTDAFATLNLTLEDSKPGGGGVPFADADPGNGTVQALPHPQYYEPLYRSVAVTLSSLVFTIGFVGNVLVVIVIARTRSMHTTTNCYLLSLAVADCLVLLSGTLPAVPETFYRIDEWPFGRALCSLLIYAQYVGVDASSLSITAFTIERYIAICHPIRAHTICTVSRAKKIIGGLWLFTLLYCGPWLGLTDLKFTLLSDGSYITKCLFRLQRSSYLTLYMIDLVVFYILPFLISTVLYCRIGRILVLTSFRHSRDRSTRTTLDRRSKDNITRASTSSRTPSDSRVQMKKQGEQKAK